MGDILESNAVALKEWAVTLWALGRGTQILLLRKGGIAEDEGEFRATAKEFFLYPTYEHEQVNLLQQQFSHVLRALESAAPGASDVYLEYYGVITDILPAPELPRMKGLREAFVWNDAFLEKRYSYRPELPLYVLLLRTYRLTNAVRLPVLDRYAGCRSWVELERALPTHGATPVLTNEQFASRREAILRRFGSQAA